MVHFVQRTQFVFLIAAMALLVILPVRARADISTGIDGIYFTDSLTTTNSPKDTKIYYDFSFYLSLYNKSNVFFGATYIGYSSTDTDSSAVTTTWSTQDYGFSAKYYFGRQKAFSVAASYLISSTANYKLGTNTAEIWNGTGLQGKASYYPQIGENLSAGISLVYYNGTYTTSRSGTTVTNVSKARTYIIPTISLVYNF